MCPLSANSDVDLLFFVWVCVWVGVCVCVCVCVCVGVCVCGDSAGCLFELIVLFCSRVAAELRRRRSEV